jgi:hypothetical protein
MGPYLKKKKNNTKRAQVKKCLTSKYEALSSNPSVAKKKSKKEKKKGSPVTQ